MTDSLDFVVAIPARYGSTRLPGKPLRLIAGEPMIVHVARRAMEAGATEVVVATDDARIAEAIEPLGLSVCMTSSDHASGTDRLAECARLRRWSDEQIVVNLQGDEPLCPPPAIRMVAAALAEGEAVIATLASRITNSRELFDPNCVKVVRNHAGHAIYFSRAPIPWDRDAFAQGDTSVEKYHWLRHIGLYAYRARHLIEFAGMTKSLLEGVECLEQLRALDAGWKLAIEVAPFPMPPGVDTEEDLREIGYLFESAVR